MKYNITKSFIKRINNNLKLNKMTRENKNIDKPSYNEAAKMFDIVDSYLCKTRNIGWEWDEAVKYIQEHWNDPEFNIDYENRRLLLLRMSQPQLSYSGGGETRMQK